MPLRWRLLGAALLTIAPHFAQAAEGQKWVVSWAASVQGPYPIGNPSAQPDQRFAFPVPASGAHDQTFRLMLRPDIWGRQARVRFSNAYGTKPVIFDGAHVGLQLGSAALVKGTNRPITFASKTRVAVAPGQTVWSDPVALKFVRNPDAAEMSGRKLAVSFHIVGESGPMTWHAKALTTSYVTTPKTGAVGHKEDEIDFAFTTASWFFIDALEMKMPADSFAIVAFGDSITDGTASTMNGDDRWTDVLSRRIHAIRGNKISVVNAGIGGNQIAGPADYSPEKPFAGGPAALQRLDRDVLALSGVAGLIWLEGINDFSKNGNASLDAVTAAMRQGVEHLRAKNAQLRIYGATVTSAFGSSSPAHGFPEQDEKRKGLNAFIRTSGMFDGIVDFDGATLDAASGGLKQEFIPESTTGGAGDKLHPNRTGYLFMGQSVDLGMLQLTPKAQH